MMKKAYQCTLMRGGTSRGPYFKMEDFPIDQELRSQVLTKIMGSGSLNQVDGLGGNNSTTNKAAIIGKSTDPSCDIDYLFAQVDPQQQLVDFSPNCGNILAGVAPFAIEAGYIQAQDPKTAIKIRNLNTGKIILAEMETPNGILNYEGDVCTSGVISPSAPIKLTFLDVAGAKTGSLFPSGKSLDLIDNIEVTCIDAATPCVIISATAMGKTGYESADELSEDIYFMKKLESIRCKAGLLMGLGDVSQKVIPKPILTSPAINNGDLSARYFVPHSCHKSLAVTGSIAIACAYISPDTIISKTLGITQFKPNILIEHPSGHLEVKVESSPTSPQKNISIIRTARKIMSGTVFVP